MAQTKNETVIASRTPGGSYVNLHIWIGDPDKPSEGLTIPTMNIDKIDIKENIFSIMPTFEMHVQDTSNFFYTHALCIGDMINIEMGPERTTMTADADFELDPFIKCSFVIQTVSSLPDPTNNVFTYVIMGIYAAQPLINEISKFPTKDTLGLLGIYEKVESDKVIDRMATEAGLGFMLECEPQDKSYWLNANETRGAFIERVIDHAWVGEGNAPVLYTDVKGMMHYTSIKDLCENISGLTFGDVASNIGIDTPRKQNIITFNRARCLNAGGPIFNRGGYTIKCSLANPYNKKGIDRFEIPQYGVNGLLSAATEVVDFVAGDLTQGVKDRSEGWREKTYALKEPFLAGVSNKQASEMDNVTVSNDGGMWFDELHEHYTLASNHNEMVRRSFFNNFVNVMIDTSRQGDLYLKPEYRPKLGQVADVDFSTTMNNKIDGIHSGAFCIAEIVHKYQKTKPYTQSITFVNDGYFGK